ncbi:MAG TPA: hypothetical protein VGE07_24485 [Herpetosiphonaceae bacterium]
MESYTLETVAEMFDVSEAEVRALVRQATAPLSQRRYYLYRRTTEGAPATSVGPRPGRTVLLFRAPDEALVFAQLGRFAEIPQLMERASEDLILSLLANANLDRLVFLEEDLERLPSGLRPQSLSELPGAHVVEREQLIDYFS